ncbi:MAG: TrkH family potassium uptake protein [Rubellimicrobium sp.]|nr:TrkH family potassium uptake protein [Rubellimicrobium sp.]
MIEIRPVSYVIGLLLTALSLTMIGPLIADLAGEDEHWLVFLEAAIMTGMVGAVMAIASSNGVKQGLTLRQGFLLTSGVWLILPLFGALPFMLGPGQTRLVDAYFEAMSAITTTGSTVLEDIELLPQGLRLWRGILQWLGGVGVIVMAMVFLPELRVGGMQVFRSEAFETMGKILPRAAEIASGISGIYVGLTVACALAYVATGMSAFDAVVHAMTTVATGGMANYDASFGAFGAGAQYVAVIFMILGALPFVRYVQLTKGTARPLLRDSQIRVFLILIFSFVTVLSLYVASRSGGMNEAVIRASLFNIVSVMTGTGYSSADYMQWGSFAVTSFFFIGLIGGCAGSTTCSIKVFRYQILFAAIRQQIRRIHSPSGIFITRFEGRAVTEETLNSVMVFFFVFILSLGFTAVLLSLTGLDFITSVSGAATALANVGPGLGSTIGPVGNFAPLNDSAKWILSAAMLAGRLEMMLVLVLLTGRFWRD